MGSNQTDETDKKDQPDQPDPTLLASQHVTDNTTEIRPFQWVEPVKRKYFEPQYWLPILVLIDGVLYMVPLIERILAGDHIQWMQLSSWRLIIEAIGLIELPRVVISLAMIFMTIGLINRARIAWVLATVLTIPMMVTSLIINGHPDIFFLYTLVVALLLIKHWSAFTRTSLAASSLFALSSFMLLLWYAFLGALYLGEQFNPHIKDFATAIYFSIVAMSTVGFGDIVPITYAARLFTVSIIVLGLTVFATSLGAVIGPIIGGTLKNAFHSKAIKSMRKNHIILCGASPFAVNIYKSLTDKGRSVTIIAPIGSQHKYPETADIIEGDASSRATLEEAGVVDAKYVLAIRADDPDNAFIVLAVKEIKASQARTVAIVNDSENLEKIRAVKPDLVLSPQMLGAELLARALTGESMEGNVVSEIFFSLHESLQVKKDS
jgi:voltage-gated potassium channel